MKKLLPLIAAAMLSCSAAQAASTSMFIFENLLFRESINAVHLDGNTGLETSAPWDAPEFGYTFFRSWWEKTGVQSDKPVVAYSVGNPTGDILLILEFPSDVFGYDQLYVIFATKSVDGFYHGATCYVPSSLPMIPRNDKWTMIQLKINTSIQECQYVVQQESTFTAAHMTYDAEGRPPEPIPWNIATKWVIGGSTDTGQPGQPGLGHITDYARPKMDIMENYVELKYDWDLLAGNGVTSLIFATNDGFARNLNFTTGFPPHLHDCAEPLAGLFAAMCDRGNANYFPQGFQVSPAHQSYTMTVHGTLQNADTDRCLIKGIGDGCSGP